MNPPLVQATPGVLPPNFCPTGPTALQSLYNEIITRTQFTLNPAYAFFNFGNTTPTPENRVYPWIRLDGSGHPDRLYTWFGAAGMWLAPNPVSASDASRRIWTGNPGTIDTYDGGNTDPLTLWSGPMWAIDSAFAARFPVGVGTFPSGSSVAVNGTGGEDEHTLTIDEMPAHTHAKSTKIVTDVQRYQNSIITLEVINATNPTDNTGISDSSFNTDSTGGGDPVTNLPPYYGVYFIKRTTRQFYAV